MKLGKKKKLHVVDEDRDLTDDIVDKIMDELKDEDTEIKELNERIMKHKRHFRQRVMIGICAVFFCVVGTYVLLRTRTYSNIQIVDHSGEQKSGTYIKFANGVLSYSKDGAVFTNANGKELWNQPYQMKHPIVTIAGETVAVADQGGNAISVFGKEGLKGEITTLLPIEKISVSEQGIVAALLENAEAPQIICYDTVGNILVEHKATVSSTGYPLDLALSPNGELLLVSYLYTQEGRITSKVSCFNFGEVGQDKTDRIVEHNVYEDMLVPMVSFMTNDTAIVVGDSQLEYYKGSQVLVSDTIIKLEQPIKSAFHNDKYVGLVLQGEVMNELRVYDKNGKEVSAVEFEGEYSNIEMHGEQIVMYEGNQCTVFMKSGHKRFEGEMSAEISEIFPIFGINKYFMVSANGLEKVRFIK